VGGRAEPSSVDAALRIAGIDDDERAICSVLTAQILGH